MDCYIYQICRILIIVDLIDLSFLSAVDGGWGAWGDWSTCPVTCGSGSQMRSRECDNPEPMNGGNDCDGEPEATQDCAIITCPPSE